MSLILCHFFLSYGLLWARCAASCGLLGSLGSLGERKRGCKSADHMTTRASQEPSFAPPSQALQALHGHLLSWQSDCIYIDYIVLLYSSSMCFSCRDYLWGFGTADLPRKFVRLQTSTRSRTEARPCGHVSRKNHLTFVDWQTFCPYKVVKHKKSTEKIGEVLACNQTHVSSIFVLQCLSYLRFATIGYILPEYWRFPGYLSKFLEPRAKPACTGGWGQTQKGQGRSTHPLFEGW